VSHNPLDDPWTSWHASEYSQSSSDLRYYYSEQSSTSNWADLDLHLTSLNNISSQDFALGLPTSETQPAFPFEPTNFQTLDFLHSSVPDGVSLTNGTNDPMPNLGINFPELSKLPSLSLPTASASQSSRSTSSSASATAASPVSNPKTAKPGRKRAISPDNDPDADAAQADRRRRNNAAAAKYRQKKIDRIAELEKALEEVSKERDGLKMQLAKRDGEVELLRGLLAKRG
jgi:hypothetical protein